MEEEATYCRQCDITVFNDHAPSLSPIYIDYKIEFTWSALGDCICLSSAWLNLMTKINSQVSLVTVAAVSEHLMYFPCNASF